MKIQIGFKRIQHLNLRLGGMNGTFHLTFLMISAVQRAVMVPQEMGTKLRCYTQEVHEAM